MFAAVFALAGPAWAGITPPATPALSAGDSARRSLTVAWTAPGDDGSSGTAAAYDLRYTPVGPIDTPAKFAAAASAGPLPAPSPAGSPESFKITGLAPDTTYYAALRAFDEVPNASGISASLTLKTLSLSTPSAVPGLRGTRSSSDFILSWSPVGSYLDGSPVDEDFTYYSVWRATAVRGPFAPAAKLSTAAASFTDPGSLGTPAFYTVTAGDALGSTGPYRAVAGNGPETPVIFPSPDGAARLEVPAALQAPLFASGAFGADLAVSWTRRTANETGPVLIEYELSAVTAAGGAEVPLAFPPPGAVLVFTAPSGTPLSRVAVFGFTGIDFTKLGGRTGPGPEVALAITRPGAYRLQESLRPESLQVTTLVPSKVFTPNGDGVNDTITVYFENPASEFVSGEVFDLNGARVAGLTRGPVADSLRWDGRDDSGRTARTGIYIYQIKGGGARANGTLVLVR